MSEAERLEELRRLFLAAPELGSTRFLAVAIAAALVLVVLWLVRRQHLRAEHAPIWMLVALGILAVSVSPSLLRGLTQVLGAWTPSSALFFLGLLFLIAICLSYAVRLSQAGVRIKNLAQEVALLRSRLDALEHADRTGPSEASVDPTRE